MQWLYDIHYTHIGTACFTMWNNTDGLNPGLIITIGIKNDIFVLLENSRSQYLQNYNYKTKKPKV